MKSELIDKEIDIYAKIYEINTKIFKILKKEEIYEDELKELMDLRQKLINELKDIEKKISLIWENWEKIKDKVIKDKVKILKNILEKNIELEKKIISIYENRIEKIKAKLKIYDRGAKALSGYKVVKVNLPIFKSFKV